MGVTTVDRIQAQPAGASRMQSQDATHHDCPDLRWPPAVRLMVLVGCLVAAWTPIILISSFLFG
jgi:hypothetical protein